jgi:hypothetical protein
MIWACTVFFCLRRPGIRERTAQRRRRLNRLVATMSASIVGRRGCSTACGVERAFSVLAPCDADAAASRPRLAVRPFTTAKLFQLQGLCWRWPRRDHVDWAIGACSGDLETSGRGRTGSRGPQDDLAREPRAMRGGRQVRMPAVSGWGSPELPPGGCASPLLAARGDLAAAEAQVPRPRDHRGGSIEAWWAPRPRRRGAGGAHSACTTEALPRSSGASASHREAETRVSRERAAPLGDGGALSSTGARDTATARTRGSSAPSA